MLITKNKYNHTEGLVMENEARVQAVECLSDEVISQENYYRYLLASMKKKIGSDEDLLEYNSLQRLQGFFDDLQSFLIEGSDLDKDQRYSTVMDSFILLKRHFGALWQRHKLEIYYNITIIFHLNIFLQEKPENLSKRLQETDIESFERECLTAKNKPLFMALMMVIGILSKKVFADKDKLTKINGVLKSKFEREEDLSRLHRQSQEAKKIPPVKVLSSQIILQEIESFEPGENAGEFNINFLSFFISLFSHWLGFAHLADKSNGSRSSVAGLK